MFNRFKEVFGFYPASTGAYYMDAELVSYIKEKYPSVKCAVATCWEEGPKALSVAGDGSVFGVSGGGAWCSVWISIAMFPVSQKVAPRRDRRTEVTPRDRTNRKVCISLPKGSQISSAQTLRMWSASSVS